MLVAEVLEGCPNTEAAEVVPAVAAGAVLTCWLNTDDVTWPNTDVEDGAAMELGWPRTDVELTLPGAPSVFPNTVVVVLLVEPKSGAVLLDAAEMLVGWVKGKVDAELTVELSGCSVNVVLVADGPNIVVDEALADCPKVGVVEVFVLADWPKTGVIAVPIRFPNVDVVPLARSVESGLLRDAVGVAKLKSELLVTESVLGAWPTCEVSAGSGFINFVLVFVVLLISSAPAAGIETGGVTVRDTPEVSVGFPNPICVVESGAEAPNAKPSSTLVSVLLDTPLLISSALDVASPANNFFPYTGCDPAVSLPLNTDGAPVTGLPKL